jgi:hypothetical protein
MRRVPVIRSTLALFTLTACATSGIASAQRSPSPSPSVAMSPPSPPPPIVPPPIPSQSAPPPTQTFGCRDIPLGAGPDHWTVIAYAPTTCKQADALMPKVVNSVGLIGHSTNVDGWDCEKLDSIYELSITCAKGDLEVKATLFQTQ